MPVQRIIGANIKNITKKFVKNTKINKVANEFLEASKYKNQQSIRWKISKEEISNNNDSFNQVFKFKQNKF